MHAELFARPLAPRWPALVMVLALQIAGAPVALAAARKVAAVSPADEALDLARTARKVYEAGQFSAAAELWRKAFRLDPSKPDYLYGVGKAEQRAGNFAKAKAAFEQLLALVPADDPLAERSRKAMAEMAKAPEAAEKAPASVEPAAPPPIAHGREVPAPPAETLEPPSAPSPLPAASTPSAAPEQPRPGAAVPVIAIANPPAWPVWGAGGVAVAAAVGAAVFAGLAMSADSDADPYRIAGTVEFDPARISQADAKDRLDTINNRWMVAGVCSGVAMVSLGALGWMKWRGAPKANSSDGPSLKFHSNGAVLAWGWR